MAIRQFQLAAENGLSLMGLTLVDQYASKPIMSREDYFKYVHPYRVRAWEALGKKVNTGYIVPSPQETEQNMQDPVLGEVPGRGQRLHLPADPGGRHRAGVRPAQLELAKKYKQTYSYFIHGKYLRDATESQLDATVQRICKLAVEVRANLMVTISSVPPGASVEKANYVFKLVEKYGRY